MKSITHETNKTKLIQQNKEYSYKKNNTQTININKTIIIIQAKNKIYKRNDNKTKNNKQLLLYT